jgi:hypothetical protein
MAAALASAYMHVCTSYNLYVLGHVAYSVRVPLYLPGMFLLGIPYTSAVVWRVWLAAAVHASNRATAAV